MKYGLYILIGFMFLLLLYLIITQRSIISTINNRALNTERVAQAFHVPAVAGQWGEVQLKRIAELAGMLPHCEFALQNEIKEGRPDMTVALPNNCIVYVDSKAPMSAYLKSIDEPHNSMKWLKENTKAIRNHISILSKRGYWQTGVTPQLTVMFIPSETVWLAALSQDAHLIDYAATHSIIVATPMTLIALLKTVSYGWQQTTIQDRATETFKKISEIKCHFSEVKDAIESALQTNNKTKQKLQDLLQLIIKAIE